MRENSILTNRTVNHAVAVYAEMKNTKEILSKVERFLKRLMKLGYKVMVKTSW